MKTTEANTKPSNRLLKIPSQAEYYGAICRFMDVSGLTVSGGPVERFAAFVAYVDRISGDARKKEDAAND